MQETTKININSIKHKTIETKIMTTKKVQEATEFHWETEGDTITNIGTVMTETDIMTETYTTDQIDSITKEVNIGDKVEELIPPTTFTKNLTNKSVQDSGKINGRKNKEGDVLREETVDNNVERVNNNNINIKQYEQYSNKRKNI